MVRNSSHDTYYTINVASTHCNVSRNKDFHTLELSNTDWESINLPSWSNPFELLDVCHKNSNAFKFQRLGRMREIKAYRMISIILHDLLNSVVNQNKSLSHRCTPETYDYYYQYLPSKFYIVGALQINYLLTNCISYSLELDSRNKRGVKVDYNDDPTQITSVKPLQFNYFDIWQRLCDRTLFSASSLSFTSLPIVGSPQKSFTAKNLDTCNPIHWWMGWSQKNVLFGSWHSMHSWWVI